MQNRSCSSISVCLHDRRSDQNKMDLLAVPPPLPRGPIPCCTGRGSYLVPIQRWPLSDTQHCVGIAAVRIPQQQPSLGLQRHQQPPTEHLMTEPAMKEEPKPCKEVKPDPTADPESKKPSLTRCVSWPSLSSRPSLSRSLSEKRSLTKYVSQCLCPYLWEFLESTRARSGAWTKIPRLTLAGRA